MLQLARSTAQYGEEVRKSSIITGLSAREISGLSFALEQSETSLADFTAGFKTFSKRLADAGVRQEKMRAQLLASVGQFHRLDTGAERAQFAIANFGKQGLQMIPFLATGRHEIEQLTIKASDLGLVIDDKVAKAADDFNDSLHSLQASV